MGDRLDPLAAAFAQRHGDCCARTRLSVAQGLWYASWGALGIWLLCFRWDYFLALASCLIAGFYFAVIAIRAAAVLLAVARSPEWRFTPAVVAEARTGELPVYTILVPLYREANVADKIIASLAALDYPRDKLDVKLLLEEDDPETRGAVDALELGPEYDVVLVPPAAPRTKPKACNHGLARARGDYVVIYDAEDRPDPDQLLKAVLTFRSVPDSVVCVQAKLNYYNSTQNALTRWFTVEYSSWFDLYLPGLQRLGLPIPLGGTSNHFHRDALIELGGWDPFNVTEDCDLGIRLCRRGHDTVVVDSTTWEEANSQLGNWLRQRSRWVKGFFQTHLTHSRHPLCLLRDLGVRRFGGFLATVGGVATMLLLNLAVWVFGAIYLGLLMADWAQGRSPWTVIAGHREELRLAWQMVYLGPLEDPLWSAISVTFFVVTVALIAANLLFILIGCLACVRRRRLDLLPWALLSPLYWVLISVGAAKGFAQLVTRPFYWEKTRHGLDHPR